MASFCAADHMSAQPVTLPRLDNRLPADPQRKGAAHCGRLPSSGRGLVEPTTKPTAYINQEENPSTEPPGRTPKDG